MWGHSTGYQKNCSMMKSHGIFWQEYVSGPKYTSWSYQSERENISAKNRQVLYHTSCPTFITIL